MRLHVSLPGPFSVSFGGGYRRPTRRATPPVYKPYFIKPHAYKPYSPPKNPRVPILSNLFPAAVFVLLAFTSHSALSWLWLFLAAIVPLVGVAVWILRCEVAEAERARWEKIQNTPRPIDEYLDRKKRMQDDELATRTSRPRGNRA